MSAGVTQNEVALSARRQVRRAASASVRLTAPMRMLPDFLVVGAQRCGTTSMFKTLAQHPGVARPFLRKGVHYFDKHYQEGPRWYRGQFPVTATSRLRRVGRGRPLTGESSPYYMFHPHSAARLARDLPGVRLIVLLRDPVERAYSAHSHERAKGFETEDFQRAVALEPERLQGEHERMLRDAEYDSPEWQHHAYLTRGHYHEQLVRLEGLVGSQRLLVIDSHEFFTAPSGPFGEVLEFLGLPWDERIAFEQHNARSRSPMPDNVRAELRDYFEPHDARLADWWKRTPSWRR